MKVIHLLKKIRPYPDLWRRGCLASPACGVDGLQEDALGDMHSLSLCKHMHSLTGLVSQHLKFVSQHLKCNLCNTRRLILKYDLHFPHTPHTLEV
jgi:hypothetical protein